MMKDLVVPTVAVEAIKQEVGRIVMQTMLQIEITTDDPAKRWYLLYEALKVLASK